MSHIMDQPNKVFRNYMWMVGIQKSVQTKPNQDSTLTGFYDQIDQQELASTAHTFISFHARSYSIIFLIIFFNSHLFHQAS